MELLKKRKTEQETFAKIWTFSKERHEMDGWREYISHEIAISNKLDGIFSCPKLHLLHHWVQQICRYGALQQYFAERHEQAHKTNFKAGWITANHNVNYLPPRITFHCRMIFLRN
jgi:hypothetical protein